MTSARRPQEAGRWSGGTRRGDVLGPQHRGDHGPGLPGGEPPDDPAAPDEWTVAAAVPDRGMPDERHHDAPPVADRGAAARRSGRHDQSRHRWFLLGVRQGHRTDTGHRRARPTPVVDRLGPRAPVPAPVRATRRREPAPHTPGTDGRGHGVGPDDGLERCGALRSGVTEGSGHPGPAHTRARSRTPPRIATAAGGIGRPGFRFAVRRRVTSSAPDARRGDPATGDERGRDDRAGHPLRGRAVAVARQRSRG
jgi:hypothetical protein